MKTAVPPSSYECILYQTVMPFHRDKQEKLKLFFFFLEAGKHPIDKETSMFFPLRRKQEDSPSEIH